MAGSGPYPMGPPPPNPGVVALRPLTLGDIFNGAFGYIRHNPKTVFGLAVIVIAVSSIVSAFGMGGYMGDYGTWVDTLMADPAADPDVLPFAPWTLIAMYAGMLLSYIGQVVLTGLLAAVVGLAVLGRKLTMRQAWAAARGRIGAVLLVALLLALIGIAWTVLLVVSLVTAVFIGTEAGAAVGLALFFSALAAVMALGAWIWVRTSLAMPVAVLEHLGAGRALARSWRITRGSWWRVFGILLLATFIAGLVSGILSTPFSLGGMVAAIIAPGATWAYVAGGAASFVGTVIAGALTVPFLVGVTTLLYVDLRMRREGLDLKLQAAAQSGHEIDAGIYLPDPAPAAGPYHPGHHPGGVPGAPA
ncbi:hypothetical protein HNR23_000196 [Nocardiopsis mwathae]|uniref:Glycerophosphoryl diester phosphodiesterase membrane domain-containing protein n=1 Tax=Nocardiopsis mwathae TaxID=1472723 RepID=A0A7X0D3V8_9ACTN|nr:glycerophosphoryl diester phosphodiesterase membrane domain-containing protein [Nocardiopsis mwathae]MBB6170136.1 hypothetical protein [Nocardiopsis mwathae]